MLNRINYKELELSRTVLLPNGEKILLRSILYADYASHRITLHCKQNRSVNLRTTFSVHIHFFTAPARASLSTSMKW